MFHINLIIYFLVLIELTSSKINNIEIVSKDYNEIIITSKNDTTEAKMLIKSKTNAFQMDIVKLLSEFEIQTIIHKNKTLSETINHKWNICKSEHNDNIVIINAEYSNNATLCVNDVQKDVNKKKKSVKYIIREIKDWRKNFNYQINDCLYNYPLNLDDAAECFKEYMEIHNFDAIIRRLLTLLEITQTEYIQQIQVSLVDLRTCLEDNFAKFMDNLRSLLTILNKCYEEKVDVKETTTLEVERHNNIDITKILCNKCVK